jgi:CDP-diacylglycerol pyrophosphatase
VRRPLVKLALIACSLTASALSLHAVASERRALWRVVQACLADFNLTGLPYPCLQVNLTSGKDRGFVVLSPPFGSPNTILSPVRRVIGIEDPWLQSPEAPNYFDAAWRARTFLKTADGRTPGRDEVALAVNSALARSQDQFHIHLGCLVPAARRAVEAFAPKLPIGKWARVGTVNRMSEFWGLRIGQTDLAGVDPFRLITQGLADQVQDQALLMIAVAGTRIANDDQMVILAFNVGASTSLGQVSAEEIVDPACLT